MTQTLLHVGLPKAGSTHLQQTVFSRIDGLDYHALARKGGRHAETGPFGMLVRTFREGHGLGFDWTAFRDWFAAALDPARPALVSEERLSDHLGLPLTEKTARLAELFQPARVLIVIRRPAALLPSMFFQERRHARYGLWRGRSLGDWTMDALRHADHHLSPAQMVRYDWIIAAFDARFGKDNVTVLPLEWLAADPAAAARLLARFLNRAEAEVAALLAASGPARNARPHNPAALLRALPGRPLTAWPRELAATLSGRRLDARYERALREFTAAAVAWTAARTGLPLAELGYGSGSE